MYIYEDPAIQNSPFLMSPFVPITQIGYVAEVLPWVKYPHLHEEEYEISYVTCGKGVLNLPGCTLPLSEHALTLVPPQTAHYFDNIPQSEAPFSYYVIRFRMPKACLSQTERLKKGHVITAVSPQVVSAIQNILETILQLSQHGRQKIGEFAQAAALSVLLLTEEVFRDNNRSIRTQTPIYANDILHYLQQHTREKVTMEDLTRTFNLSQSHIFRVFMKTYHTSPINYLIYCRMREARTCILNQNMTSQEIARLLAYSNPYHFIRTFEKFYGCHPDHYREQAWEFLQGNPDDMIIQTTE